MLNVFLEQLTLPHKNLKIELKKGTTSIGRKNTDIIISDPNVSHLHSEIHYNGTRVYIYDKNSTNGTYVNNERVKKTALKDGDLIYIAGSKKSCAASFRLNIIRVFDKDKIFYVEKEPKKLKFYSIISVSLLMIFFIIWLIIPSPQEIAREKIKINVPWENVEDLPAVPYKLGEPRTLVFNDTVFLPPNIDWNTSTRYEEVQADNVYEPRLYIVDINSNSSQQEEDIKAILTIQRFKEDFSDDIQNIVHDSFIWNETTLKKSNNINFKYSKTPRCIWQWGGWKTDLVHNVYATCISYRGRMILQASSFNSFMLNRFFNFFVQSYEEGVQD